MAIADFAPHRPVESLAVRLVRAIARWIADRRAERARVTILQDLLLAPEHRLRDLGIRREELIQAVERHRPRARSGSIQVDDER